MSRCDNPNCQRPAEETYTDLYDNDVDVCATCYYNLVTRGSASGSSTVQWPAKQWFNSNWSLGASTRTDDDDCLHDQLEENRPPSQKGQPHQVNCNCSQCRGPRY